MKKILGTASTFTFFLFGGAIAGARFVLDAIGRVSTLEDIGDKQGNAAKALNWFLSTPWWAAALIMVASACMFLYMVHGIFSDVGRSSASTPHRKSDPILAAVFGQTHERPARFAFQADVTIREVDIFLEYSTCYGMSEGGWTAPNKLQLAHLDRVVKGDTKTVPIIGSYSVKNFDGRTVTSWKFGSIDENRHMIVKEQLYRCRIKLIYSDDNEVNTYFLLKMETEEIGPTVIGEHLFDHVYEWEGETPKFPRVVSLFT